MRKSEYSVALTQALNEELMTHLVRDDREEDLTFALWTPSKGDKRLTALVHTVIFPGKGDRQRHGNASFNPQYFERVCKLAMEKDCGVAFMHSHPVPGWQGMSDDDIRAENKIMGSVAAITGLPLLGMTTGSDETWSGRFWLDDDGKSYKRKWCSSIRVLGKTLLCNFNDHLLPKPEFNEMFRRTVSVWGEGNHSHMARLKIGIVGLGSVGGAVAMSLARSGFTRLAFIDHDEIQVHNLDRLDYATKQHLGMLKIEVAKQRALEIATASQIGIDVVPFSVVEEAGYQAALNCDVLISCVDRPRPRSILNHFAYAHLIPVVDGGIAVRFKNGKFSGVEWQVQTVGPNRPCLKCVGAYSVDDVSTEIEGNLDNSLYIKGLPADHRFRRNENVYPFSQNLASLEVLHLVATATGCGGIDDLGVQRFRYNPGILESDTEKSCLPSCQGEALIASGDSNFCLSGKDFGAEEARLRQKLIFASSQKERSHA